MIRKLFYLAVCAITLFLFACAQPTPVPSPTPTTSPTDLPTPDGTVCISPVDAPVVDGKVSYHGVSFRLDPALASSLAAIDCPNVPLADNLGPGEAHPAYTAFVFPDNQHQNTDFQPEIRVYDVTGDMQSYAYPLNRLDNLRSLLDQRAEPVDWFAAPLHTHETYLDFKSGTGVRGLVQYMQNFFFFTNNGLIYDFSGLTQDGHRFVQVRFPVSVPFLMDLDGLSLPPVNLNPQAIPIPPWPDTFEEQTHVIQNYNDEAMRRFEQLSDAEAQPDLGLLDALVRSIQIENP